MSININVYIVLNGLEAEMTFVFAA